MSHGAGAQAAQRVAPWRRILRAVVAAGKARPRQEGYGWDAFRARFEGGLFVDLKRELVKTRRAAMTAGPPWDRQGVRRRRPRPFRLLRASR